MRVNDELFFDVLQGEEKPTDLFGAPLCGTSGEQAASALAELAVGARKRVADVFGVVVSPDPPGVMALDALVAEMWRTGWDPSRPSFERFVTDLGVLYAEAIIGIRSLVPIHRSVADPTHFSCRHAVAGVEFFPFHKVAKALRSAEGESLLQFYQAAAALTQGA